MAARRFRFTADAYDLAERLVPQASKIYPIKGTPESVCFSLSAMLKQAAAMARQLDDLQNARTVTQLRAILRRR